MGILRISMVFIHQVLDVHTAQTRRHQGIARRGGGAAHGKSREGKVTWPRYMPEVDRYYGFEPHSLVCKAPQARELSASPVNSD